jgi:hypothetical protein
MPKKIWNIKSFNFTGWDATKINLEEAKQQIDAMVEKCTINSVTFAVGALQDHCYSICIDWKGPHMFRDEQIIELIRYARDRELKVIMKPMLNTRDGYWRAYIRFFDEDVPCEPKWSEWFKNYTEYIVHFAELCEKEGADMLIVGCELVGTDHREQEWKELVRQVRQVYSGLVTYNCDKYQEHNVKWWDALDAISSSGYYSEKDWDNQIKRIEKVVHKYGKPFFFSEVGCPATESAALVPNDWTVIGKRPLDLEEQNTFFKLMFAACEPLDWHYGYCIWDWPMNVRTVYNAASDAGYSVIGKPAEATIKNCFSWKG